MGDWGPAGKGGPPGLRDGPYGADAPSMDYRSSSGPPADSNPLTGPPAPLNEDGLPVRPDKEPCLYYLNTGSCRSGTQCIFHHPPKAERDDELKKSLSKAGMPTPPSGMLLPPISGGPSDSAPAGPSAVAAPGMAGMLEKLEALQAEGSSGDAGKSADANAGTAPAPALQQQQTPREPMKEVEYNEEGLPIRPGQQKCGHFMRSGKCTYGPTCRFDHPAGLGGLMATPGLGSFPHMGNFPGMIGNTEGAMAMRPGREQCPFLARTGSCPFGPECRFDHSGKAADSNPDSLSKQAEAQPESRKKSKGLGGVRGRRPPPIGQRKF